MLSTKSLLDPETLGCEHMSMTSEDTPSTVSGRIDFVMAVCKYPSQDSLAGALGEKSQTITNWRRRDSIGRGGKKLREVTGVSTDWMQGGVGEPFPDGPIPYAGPMPTDTEKFAMVQNGLDDIALAVIALCRTINARSQAEARELAERLEAALAEVQKSGRKAPFLKNLRDKALNQPSHMHPHPRGRRE